MIRCSEVQSIKIQKQWVDKKLMCITAQAILKNSQYKIKVLKKIKKNKKSKIYHC